MKKIFKKIESLINRSPFYNFVRFNPVSDLIVEFKTKRTKKAITFFSSFLDLNDSNKLVFDIGANKGSKVKALLKIGFGVIAVEPEKKALSTLYWRFGKNKNVTIIEKGVSEQESKHFIHIAESRSGLNTLSDKWVHSLETENENRWYKKHSFRKRYEIEVTTLDHLFSEYGIPYFIKIDVEGYESRVIKGMNHMPSILSFETNLPEFFEETLESIQHLLTLSDKIAFNYSLTDMLASEKWFSHEEITDIMRDPSVRYMEIICKKMSYKKE